VKRHFAGWREWTATKRHSGAFITARYLQEQRMLFRYRVRLRQICCKSSIAAARAQLRWHEA
jgi:hypothetical protein